MASTGELVGWNQLHTSRIVQTTGWITDSAVGRDNFVFYSFGAKVEVSAYFYWFDKNSITVNIYGRNKIGSSEVNGFKSLSVTGSHALTGGWSTQEWKKYWDNGDGTISHTDGAETNLCDFWVLSVASHSGDEREFRIQTVNMRCFSRDAFDSLVGKLGQTIKGRGWYTDRWWGIAMIDHTWTGTEGAPINVGSWGSMPRFSSTAIAMSYATSWTGTYITAATADACLPSAQTF